MVAGNEKTTFLKPHSRLFCFFLEKNFCFQQYFYLAAWWFSAIEVFHIQPIDFFSFELVMGFGLQVSHRIFDTAQR